MTTIKLNKDVVAELVSLKVHPRETYEDVIIRLLAERHKLGAGIPSKEEKKAM